MRKLAISITIIAAACLLVLAFVLEACSNGLTDLPIETIEWADLPDGSTQFCTNNPEHYGWSFYLIEDSNHPDEYEIECKKISGSADYGYGIIFGAKDIKNFYYIKIDVNGWFLVNKVVNGKLASPRIREWQKADPGQLASGYNVVNAIKVIRTGSKYTIYFNGKKAWDFTDISDTSITGGDMLGFIADIGNKTNEKFPNKPVDVRFWFK